MTIFCFFLMPDRFKYKRLEGSRVLILGGTSGIGFAVAEAVLEAGAQKVVLSSSNPNKVNQAVERLKTAYPDLTSRASVTGHPCDLSNIDSMESNIETLLNFATSYTETPLDHLVNTAGAFLNMAELHDVSAATIRDASNLKSTAAIMLAKHATRRKYMAPGPGSSMVLTSGSTADKPYPGRYLASCIGASLQGLTKGLALDLAPLRVNLVLPGAVDTEHWDSLPVEAKKGILEGVGKECLTGSAATPAQVAEAYLYAMKDANATGAMIGTNGGSLLYAPKTGW